jgi:hypothetical protein
MSYSNNSNSTDIYYMEYTPLLNDFFVTFIAADNNILLYSYSAVQKLQRIRVMNSSDLYI